MAPVQRQDARAKEASFENMAQRENELKLKIS